MFREFDITCGIIKRRSTKAFMSVKGDNVKFQYPLFGREKTVQFNRREVKRYKRATDVTDGKCNIYLFLLVASVLFSMCLKIDKRLEMNAFLAVVRCLIAWAVTAYCVFQLVFAQTTGVKVKFKSKRKSRYIPLAGFFNSDGDKTVKEIIDFLEKAEPSENEDKHPQFQMGAFNFTATGSQYSIGSDQNDFYYHLADSKLVKAIGNETEIIDGKSITCMEQKKYWVFNEDFIFMLMLLLTFFVYPLAVGVHFSLCSYICFGYLVLLTISRLRLNVLFLYYGDNKHLAIPLGRIGTVQESNTFNAVCKALLRCVSNDMKIKVNRYYEF